MDIRIKVFPEIGEAFIIETSIDANKDEDEQIAEFLDENICHCAEYEIIE